MDFYEYQNRVLSTLLIISTESKTDSKKIQQIVIAVLAIACTKKLKLLKFLFSWKTRYEELNEPHKSVRYVLEAKVANFEQLQFASSQSYYNVFFNVPFTFSEIGPKGDVVTPCKLISKRVLLLQLQ